MRLYIIDVIFLRFLYWPPGTVGECFETNWTIIITRRIKVRLVLICKSVAEHINNSLENTFKHIYRIQCRRRSYNIQAVDAAQATRQRLFLNSFFKEKLHFYIDYRYVLLYEKLFIHFLGRLSKLHCTFFFYLHYILLNRYWLLVLYFFLIFFFKLHSAKAEFQTYKWLGLESGWTYCISKHLHSTFILYNTSPLIQPWTLDRD